MEALSIGRVISQILTTMKRRWLSWLILGTVFSAAPGIVFEVIRWRAGVTDQSFLEAMRGLPGEMLITAVLTVCLNVAAIRGVFDHYEGADSGVQGWLRVIPSLFWPCLGLSILINLGVVFGLFLLIIPGLFLMVGLSIALPARIAENRGVDAAMRRSFALSKGSRWQIFALILMAGVGLVVLAAVNEIFLVSIAPFVGAVIGYPVITALLAVVLAVGQATIYEELVAIKGGGRMGRTADIFA